MTHRAVRPRRLPRIWILPVAGIVALVGVSLGGVLSQSLIPDLLAWWPVWLLLTLLTLLARRRRLGRLRLSGLASLIALGALGAFLAGHLQGWALMPSAAIRLVGPVADVESASLSTHLDGVLLVHGGDGFLYQVSPIRRGGEIGVAEATEEIGEETMSVALDAPPDPGFYRFAGWEVALSPQPVWRLALDGEVQADLAALRIEELALGGEGSVSLGPALVEGLVTITGAYRVDVPAGAAVRVEGLARVPASWEQLPDGSRSPAEGEGWLIIVAEGASVTVTEG